MIWTSDSASGRSQIRWLWPCGMDLFSFFKAARTQPGKLVHSHAWEPLRTRALRTFPAMSRDSDSDDAGRRTAVANAGFPASDAAGACGRVGPGPGRNSSGPAGPARGHVLRARRAQATAASVSSSRARAATASSTSSTPCRRRRPAAAAAVVGSTTGPGRRHGGRRRVGSGPLAAGRPGGAFRPRPRPRPPAVPRLRPNLNATLLSVAPLILHRQSVRLPFSNLGLSISLYLDCGGGGACYVRECIRARVRARARGRSAR